MKINQALNLLFVLALASSAPAATFTVTTTADGGPGSLRTTIEQANDNPGADTIAFNLPGPGPHVITLLSQLPDITGDATVVDGTTQPGYGVTPQVVLSGLSLGTYPVSNYRANGLVVRGNDCQITGLGFIGFAPQPGQPTAPFWDDSSVGIRLHGRRILVQHCVLGMSPDGTTLDFAGSRAANLEDIQIRGQACVVENVTARNLSILSAGADDNIVRSSRFGFQRNGNLFTAAEEAGVNRSSFGGIFVDVGLRNLIGQPGAGNHARWIVVQGAREFKPAGAEFTTVSGNIVGAAADGSVPAAGNLGIVVSAAVRNTLIGGSAPGAGNVIYGRPAGHPGGVTSGVATGDSEAAPFYTHWWGVGTRIEGNEIRGAAVGVEVKGWSRDRQAIVSITGNRFRDCDVGVYVAGGWHFPNAGSLAWDPGFASIHGNLFSGAMNMPVNLQMNRWNGSNLDPNDPLDADGGGGISRASNEGQNHPVITAVTYNATLDRTEVSGQLDSAPSRAYRVELYSSPAGGVVRGDISYGTIDFSTDAAGTGLFQFAIPGVHPGRQFSALASDLAAGGLTSEMGPGLQPPVGTFSIAPSVVAVNEAGVSATLRIRRSGGSYGPASVRLAVDGSTAASADLRFLYGSITATPPIVSFASGETEQLVDLFAFNDALNEPAEVFAITLTQPTSGASVSAAETVVLVADNDPLPTFSVNDVTVNESAGQAQFTVSLSAASGRQTEVLFSTQPLSAVAPDDYTETVTTVTFAPGETSKTVSVPIVDSVAFPEFTEAFQVRLSNPVQATLADDTGTGTILDLDGPPAGLTGFRFHTEPFATPEGGFFGSAFVTIRRTDSLVGAASVRISTDFFSANAADVTPLVEQQVLFADGEEFKVVTLTLNDDALDEADEFLFLRLSDPAGPAGATLDPVASTLAVTLLDDDALPTVKLEAASALEGDGGVKTVNMTLTLSTASGRDVWIGLLPTDGDADAADFVNAASVIIPAGATTGQIPIEIIGDVVNEPDEIVVFTPVTLDGHPAVGGKLVIQNDDPEQPTFRLEGVPPTVTEGIGEFSITLRRVGDLSGTDWCRVKVASDTPGVRLDSEDFIFPPGESAATVKLRVRDDNTDEPGETVSLALNPELPAVTQAPGTWSFVVLDDDEPPVLSIGDTVTVTERDAGSVSVLVYLRLSASSAFPVRALGVRTVNGSATEGLDYAPLGPIDIELPAGTTERAVEISVTGDRLDEADETFFVLLSGGVENARPGTSEVAITIQDNDTPQRDYRNWLAGHFTPEERRTDITAPCADPDGDGLSNGLEYYLDSDPRSAASGRDRITLERYPGEMVWITTGIASRAAFVTPHVEESDDLITWLPLSRAEEVIALLPPDLQRHKVRAVYTEPKLFLRMRTLCREFEPEP